MTGKPRRGLGRGLGALIPTAPEPEQHISDHASTGNESDPGGLSGTGQAGASGTPESAGIMSVAPADANGQVLGTGSHYPGASTGAAARTGNRVPSVADLARTTVPEGHLEPPAVPGAVLREVPLDAVTMNPRQPRTVFDEESLAELAFSIKEFGVLQPIVVRPLPAPGQAGEADRPDIQGAGQDVRPAAPAAEGSTEPGSAPDPIYELVMGERRWRAAKEAGLATIPAIVRDTADEAMLRDALLENLHRVQLNPLEEAAAYQQLLAEFGVTHDELAARIGRSRSQVTNTIRLMNLPVPVQRRVAAGVLSAGHARALLGLPEADSQDELAAKIVAEGLSVRATEELVTLALADAGGKPRRRKPAAPKITAPALSDLANNLSEALDTRVRVDLGRHKGKITVEFGSVDDLERIVAIIAPELATKRES